MKKVFSVFISLLMSLIVFGQENERITSFHSDMVIDVDGTVRVTEHIAVYAAGREIKQGIVRKIPLYRTDRNGKRKKVDIQMISVQFNNSKINSRIDRETDDILVYTADHDVFLEPGTYLYTITYESRGHIDFFDEFDELCWNVTGNDWKFPIEKATANVRLPGNLTAINTTCYTGESGSTATDCGMVNQGNLQLFYTHHSLQAGEGLTIAVSFPRDFIQRPLPPSKARLLWNEYKNPVSALAILLLGGYFFIVTWRRVGRNPKKPAAVPDFKPPYDWLPAVTRYLYRRKYDSRAFTATLVGMAVKGALNIEYDEKKYSLEKGDNTQLLSPEEQQVYDVLFAKSKTLNVNNENHSRFSKAGVKLEKSIKKTWKIRKYFRHHWLYVLIGGVVTVLVMLLYVQLIDIDSESDLPTRFQWVTAVIMLLMPLLYVAYIFLIKTPTVLGAKTKAELEGFRTYLKTDEDRRLNMLSPPEKTPELFEKLLPYAIALNVDSQWCKKFDKVLKQLNYQPQWFKSSEPVAFAALIRSFGNSFHASINSARIRPSSSAT